MKYFNSISVLLLSLIIVASCNIEKEEKKSIVKELSEEEKEELLKDQNDSIMVYYDSLYHISINIPPLIDKELFDSVTTVKFFELAQQTGGNITLLANSQLIASEIIKIIDNYSEDGADILFLIDKTGSMVDDLQNIKKGLNQIINSIKNFEDIRIAFALYGDKNVDKKEYGFDWFSFKNCETDYEKAKDFIKGITVTGGGDYPESVYEGFFESLEQDFWKSGQKRMILLIGDAPPLEKPLTKYSISDVITKAKEDKINMNFYPVVVTPTVGKVKNKKTFSRKNIIKNLYPNPSFGIINIDFAKTGNYKLEIFSATGKIVLSDDINDNKWRKELYDLDNGVYMIRVQDDDKNFETQKVILKK